MEADQTCEPWNKGKLVGQKPPLKPKDIWAIRFHLQNEHQVRDLALFNLGIHTTLRPRELLGIRVADVQGLQSGEQVIEHPGNRIVDGVRIRARPSGTAR